MIRIYLYFAQSRIFWRLKNLFEKTRFAILAQYFKLRFSLGEEIGNTNTFWQLLRLTLPQLVFAMAIATTIQWLDKYFNTLPFISQWNVPDNSDYVSFLATVAGIGGVFIGLYYAGVATVCSAIYSRVPNNIRDLLVREQVGNVYMRYLAFVTFLSVCLIGFRVFGLPRLHLATLVVGLLSGVGIIAFVKLGQRAFYLFDPTQLAYPLFADFRLWLKQVSAGGFGWTDPSFQYHAHRQARVLLNTLDTLSDISAKEPHLNGKPFVDLVCLILGFLVYYQVQKNRIPSYSRWYAQRYVHRDWYKTEDTTVDIAIRTGTSLNPEVVANKDWVEETLIPLVLRCVDINLREKRFELVSELLSYVDEYLKILAQHGEIKQAFNVANALAEKLANNISKPVERTVLKDESLEHIGLSEYLGIAPTTILLSYLNRVNNLSREQISKQLLVIRWNDPVTLYKNGFNAYTLPQLEWFMRCLQFEHAVEGKTVSPLWYQTELVVQVEAERFAENMDILLHSSKQYYQRWYDFFEKAKHPWLVAACSSREWENWKKMEIHLQKFGEIWQSFSKNRCIDGLAWPQLDMTVLPQQIKAHQDEILRKMAQQGVLLVMSQRPNNFPDYGGQFVNAVSEGILDALVLGDARMIRDLFPSYFVGCLKKFDDLRPKAVSADWRTHQKILIASAPLLDLLELCGYARLYADFHNKPDLWSPVEELWNEYLEQNKSTSPLVSLSAVIGLTDARFGIPPHGVLRTGWKQRIEHQLRQLPRKAVYRHNSARLIVQPEAVVLHSSPLVRLFARYGFYNGIDVFISLYLCKRPEAKGLDFGWRTHELEKSLKLEEEHYMRYTSETGPEGEEE